MAEKKKKPAFETKTEDMAAKVGGKDTKVTAVTQTVDEDKEILSADTGQVSTDDTMPKVDPSLMDTEDMSKYKVDTIGPEDSTVGKVATTNALI